MTSEVQHLLFKLCASKKAVNELNGLAKDQFRWEDIISTDEHRSMYYMYILLSFVGDGSEKELAELRNEPSEEVRAALRLGVLRHKGIQWAVKILKELKITSMQYVGMIVNLIMIYVCGSLADKLPTDVKQLSCTGSKEKKSNLSSGLIEHGIVATLKFDQLSCYRDLAKELKGEAGETLLAEIDAFELLKNTMRLLDELLSLEVFLLFYQ